MEELVLLGRFLLAFIFLSAAFSKLSNMQTHISVLHEYRLLPKVAVPFAARVEVYMELLVGLFLLLGIFQLATALVTAGLLVIYCMAVAINLLRGRAQISCGCGGIVGEHQLSWFLVVRNLVLVLLCLLLTENGTSLGSLQALFIDKAWREVYGQNFFIILMVSVGSLCLFLAGQELSALRTRILNVFEN